MAPRYDAALAALADAAADAGAAVPRRTGSAAAHRAPAAPPAGARP